MKCIHCATDATHKERANGKCPKCSHKFAFDPRDGDKLTDGAMQRAIEVAGSQGQVKFLPEHAFLVWCRLHPLGFWLRPWPLFGPWSGVVIGAGVVVIGLFSNEWWLAGISAAATLWAANRVLEIKADLPQLTTTQAMDEATFGALLSRFEKTHGKPANLLRPRGHHPSADGHVKTPAIAAEAAHYSFDRAVICDRADIVDVLISNDFHFENNCALLTADGHPSRVFKTVRAMLRNNPKLVVVVLHDSSPDGCRLPEILRNHPDWFAKTAQVIDVGLRPDHAPSFSNQTQRLSFAQPVAAGDGLSRGEAVWLTKYRLSLAAIIPEQLVKRLHAAFVQAEAAPAPDPATAGDNSIVQSDVISVSTSGSDGGADSFG